MRFHVPQRSVHVSTLDENTALDLTTVGLERRKTMPEEFANLRFLYYDEF